MCFNDHSNVNRIPSRLSLAQDWRSFLSSTVSSKEQSRQFWFVYLTARRRYTSLKILIGWMWGKRGKNVRIFTYIKGRLQFISVVLIWIPIPLLCPSDARSKQRSCLIGKSYFLSSDKFIYCFHFVVLWQALLEYPLFPCAFQVDCEYWTSLWLVIRFAVWRPRVTLMSCNTIRSMATTSSSDALQYD